ncbi:peptide N-acetyl-beta-D-glucosaminyl asparaginase amidase A-domain-containing protein [Phellopilus nigrolimitatus]|nr:peptide N-acetyl-beta-D-glucosaminyl asparaginase amidase A-domain-containing protein [Phellopilus nigrolimitatus]
MRSPRLWSLLLVACTRVAHAAVLVDFQVAQPPPLPEDVTQCTQVLIQHTFGNSFGTPAIANFTPPTDCGEVGSWVGISLNLTVTSNGTQFDRLGIFTFQNTEIWRTSTPEPTGGDGIIWTYLKDVTRYIPLFSKPGEFIFELDNLLETGLDGQYASTVSATFFASSAAHPAAKKADLIIPISAQSGSSSDDDAPSVPPAISLNVTFPTNTIEVYAELFASGNGNEEFWYFNTANEFVGDLPAGTTFGDGPFREVRLLVDGMVAGVAFPYAVIFTGGIIPTAWRPITSYGALDQPTYFVDLTPFAPLLADGQPHNISLDVASAEANHTLNQNWFVSGLVQVVTDPSGARTTGNITRYEVAPFAVTNTTGSVGANGDVNVTVSATRSVHIEAQVVSGSGTVNNVVFSQELAYSNTQNYLDNTTIQNVFQSSTGSVSSTHNGVASVTDDFSYPFNINLTILNPNGTQFTATFNHSYIRTILPAPFLLGSTITEHQLATGFFTEASSGNTGNGTSTDSLVYADTAGNTFDREVSAVLNNITADHQGGSLAPASAFSLPGAPLTQAVLGEVARFPGGRLKGNSGNGQ